MKKPILLGISLAIIVGAGLGVLIWWLVAGRHSSFTTILLEENALGTIPYNAAFTRIRGAGDIFWWFYPTTRSDPSSQPLILWLDGVTGIPPSLLANFGMFGPYDLNMNERTNSWVDNYNLLFVDAPLGTGFSKAERDNQIPKSLEQNSNHLLNALESFYNRNSNYTTTPLYIFGEGHGAQLALSLAIKLAEDAPFEHNLKRVVIGNGIIDPTIALTKLGFYLEELAYVDNNGRNVLETFSNETRQLVADGQNGEAFDKFLSLGRVINEEAGAVAVNLAFIADKLTRESTAVADDFGLRKYVQDASHSRSDILKFMDETVAPALGISNDRVYDEGRVAVLEAFRNVFLLPAVHLSQLEWIENLEWSGKDEFISSPRRTLIVNSRVEGYFRETPRLQFYWMNAAGLSVPFDSPVAMRRVLERILI
ncbi:uncharacterized protein LOC113520990 isoform X2 [Galleria mellonella]|uniref:Uncharacterized protein LOC113520990 isoform X2 n=1 Tax=Galleria mellonella TaxID=7137 RepID=A0ABM3MTJ7_GALME|nr:uncharacterized protein LOC113520990 isoform X2 [Galleria mellonella]